MSGNGVNSPSHMEESFAESKGKGKAAQDDISQGATMTEDDDDDEDDEDDENEEDNVGGDDEDGMEEIDLNNIVEGGRRTRGTKIDFAKAAEQLPADDEDEEDDEDFQPAIEDTEMSG